MTCFYKFGLNILIREISTGLMNKYTTERLTHMKKVSTFESFFYVHLYSTKDAKVDQGVQLFFSFPMNIVSNKVKNDITK